jgi:hypothetical protein
MRHFFINQFSTQFSTQFLIQILAQAFRKIYKKSSLHFGVFLLLFFANPAWSWGPLGHQAICDAAWRGSSNDIKKELGAAAKRMGYKTFASGCLWADHIRSKKEYDYLKPLHYMNVPKDQLTIEKDPCGDEHFKKPSCVLSAITFYSKRWFNEQLSRRERDEALFLMSHFIGDIHQPLHVGFADDRGGTRKKITFEGRTLSLHQFWDSKVLTCGKSQSWRQLGQQLYVAHDNYLADAKIDVEKAIASKFLVEPSVWAQESYDLTRQIYQLLTNHADEYYCPLFNEAAIKRLELASVRLLAFLKHR